MEGSRGGQAAAAIVAQRLCDLLLQFPAAAISGVRWRVLVKRYEERYGGRLDIGALGHSSAVAAATALLWDVLRLAGNEDAENPLLAVEDGVALTPRPSFIGTWPSLYVTLCAAVHNNGTLEPPTEAEAARGVQMRGLLLSQLKPLLQSHWHANFDDYGMGYVSEEGVFVKMKKMKHLVQAVLQWRDQRVEWRQSSGTKSTEADKVLHPKMELVVSKSHNDLVLRCPVERAPPTTVVEEVPATKPWAAGEELHAAKQRPVAEDRLSVCSTSSRRSPGSEVPVDDELERELAELRAENAALRRTNEHLLRDRDWDSFTERKMQTHSGQVPQPLLFSLARDEQEGPEPDVFDDPFEPPPQRTHPWAHLATTPTAASTATPGLSTTCSTPVLRTSTASFEIFSGTTTRASMTPLSSFDVHSGAMTPVPAASLGEKVCALVPMWFSWMPSTASFLGDRSDIPTGIVDRIRSQIEAAGPDTAKPVHPPQDWRL
mmetsp:Transcript_51285/g.153331  ORF Transcript_51285/g.153331 Transcript_51285/m.153331 type:complete len:488 (+) Transcript_51285:63-1526(+)